VEALARGRPENALLQAAVVVEVPPQRVERDEGGHANLFRTTERISQVGASAQELDCYAERILTAKLSACARTPSRAGPTRPLCDAGTDGLRKPVDTDERSGGP
jgi:hypothetical protein